MTERQPSHVSPHEMGMFVAGAMLRSPAEGHGHVESDDPRPEGAELRGVCPRSAGEIEDVTLPQLGLGMNDFGELGGVLIMAVWMQPQVGLNEPLRHRPFPL
jgi:hypothetical protein